MYRLLVTLMLIAALSELKVSWSDFKNCHGRGCIALYESKLLNIVNIDWKPIVVFPEEAKRWKEIERKAVLEEAKRKNQN